MSVPPLPPLYMWAGGKTKMLSQYASVWPVHDGPYVEPFFGAGAVFGWVSSNRPDIPAVIGDVNAELTGLLATVRDTPDTFLTATRRLVRTYLALDNLADRKQWYYHQRALYWQRPTSARLYVLMRLGFNGIWQTCRDSNGLYGTPAGLLRHVRSTQVVDPDLVRTWSRALCGVDIHTGSYASIPLPAEPSLIYLDPPYRNSFANYGTQFSDTDQKNVATWFREQVSNGHRVLLANRVVEADSFFEDLLADVADFYYFDVTYTAGRRAATAQGYMAKAAREFLAVSRS